MPSPLAPDPIRFSHVFVVYSEPIEILWREHLSFYLYHYPIRDMNPSIGAISRWTQVDTFTSTETTVAIKIKNGQTLDKLGPVHATRHSGLYKE